MLTPGVRTAVMADLEKRKWNTGRVLPLLSRENAKSLHITQDFSILAFGSSGTAGSSVRSWRLAIHGHVVFEELRLSLRASYLHCLLIHVAHGVPFSRETFASECLPHSGHRTAPGQVCRRPDVLCENEPLHAHFQALLMSRMWARFPLW